MKLIEKTSLVAALMAATFSASAAERTCYQTKGGWECYHHDGVSTRCETVASDWLCERMHKPAVLDAVDTSTVHYTGWTGTLGGRSSKGVISRALHLQREAHPYAP